MTISLRKFPIIRGQSTLQIYFGQKDAVVMTCLVPNPKKHPEVLDLGPFRNTSILSKNMQDWNRKSLTG